MAMVRLALIPGKGYEEARAEVVRWLRGFEWEVRGERVLTPRGNLRLPAAPEPWTAVLRPREDAGALAVIALFRLLAPEALRLELEGSMFAFSAACTWLQRNGLPSDPWQVTGRELYRARSRRLGDARTYLVELSPEERAALPTPLAWLEPGERVAAFPMEAEPVGPFPENRIWRLAPKAERGR